MEVDHKGNFRTNDELIYKQWQISLLSALSFNTAVFLDMIPVKYQVFKSPATSIARIPAALH
jgi:hypothetical protein